MLRRMADRFPAVVELDLSQSASRSFFPGVTDSDLAVVAAGFPGLRVIILQNCKGVSDAGMTKLGLGLPSLHSLDVACCRKLSDKGLSAIASSCRNLRALHVAGCRSITDSLLQSLSKHCCQLEELDVMGCFNITDSGITTLVEGCRHIKCLNVSKCTEIGDVGISKVAEVCSESLTCLKLEDLYKVGDESVVVLSKFCPNLETLVLGGCRRVSDEGIRSLAHGCGPSLRRLRLDWCLNMTDSSLSLILSNSMNLVALDIGCCENITDMAFQGLSMGGFKSKMKAFKANDCRRITVSGLAIILQFCLSLGYLDLTSCVHITKSNCEQAGLDLPEQCKVKFTDSLYVPDTIREQYF